MQTQMESAQQDTHTQMESVQTDIHTRMESIESAVAKGIEEHEVLHEALDKTNARLDQLLMHLVERTN